MVPLYSVTETIHEGVKYVYTIKPTLLTIEETQTEVWKYEYNYVNKQTNKQTNKEITTYLEKDPST